MIITFLLSIYMAYMISAHPRMLMNVGFKFMY